MKQCNWGINIEKIMEYSTYTVTRWKNKHIRIYTRVRACACVYLCYKDIEVKRSSPPFCSLRIPFFYCLSTFCFLIVSFPFVFFFFFAFSFGGCLHAGLPLLARGKIKRKGKSSQKKNWFKRKHWFLVGCTPAPRDLTPGQGKTVPLVLRALWSVA